MFESGVVEEDMVNSDCRRGEQFGRCEGLDGT